MNKLEKAKEIIKENIEYAMCGIFETQNILGDSMDTVYKDDELQIDICYDYSYFEVFGLGKDFKKLEKYYEELVNECDEG